MKNIKKTILLLTIISLFIFTGCEQEPRSEEELLIVASSFPLYEFAREIAHSDQVEMLIQPGADVHHYDLRPSDIIKLDKADLIIFTGEEMEPWLENILELEGKHKGKTLQATKKVRLIRAENHHQDDHHEHEDHDNDHNHKENKTNNLLEVLDKIIHDWEDGEITSDQAIQKIDDALHKKDESHQHSHDYNYEEAERNEIENELHTIFHDWEENTISLEQALNKFEETIHKFKDKVHSNQDHDDHHHHHHSEYDPHIWLDFENSIEIVNAITSKLSELRPEKEQEYRENADEYVRKLRELHQKYKEELSKCEIRHFITNHDSFRYLAHKYDLKQIPIRGLSAEQEPSPRTIANIINEAKEHDIQHVFFEELASPRVSEAIAKEIDAETLILSPAENIPSRDWGKKTFLDLMKENLNSLKIGLRCE